MIISRTLQYTIVDEIMLIQSLRSFSPTDCVKITICSLKSSMLRNMSNCDMVLLMLKPNGGFDEWPN